MRTAMDEARKSRKRYGITPEPPDVKPSGRYTTAEAAEKLMMHRNTVTNYFKAGMLRPIDATARRLRYTGSELMRFWTLMTKIWIM